MISSGDRAIHWSINNLLVATHRRKVGPIRQQSLTANSLSERDKKGFISASPIYDKLVTGLVLYRSSTSNNSCSEFTLQWSYQEDIFLKHSSFILFLTFFLKNNVPWVMWEKIQTFHLNLSMQWSFIFSPLTRYESALTTDHCNKKLLWWRQRAVLLSVHTHKYLAGSLVKFSCSKITNMFM